MSQVSERLKTITPDELKAEKLDLMIHLPELAMRFITRGDWQHQTLSKYDIQLMSHLMKMGIAQWTSLSLQFNYMGDEAVKLLCDHLNVTSGIQSLFLEGNAISDEGFRHCLIKLQNHPSLEIIHFDINYITDSVLFNLKEFLTHQEASLRKLDLWWNDLSLEVLDDLSQLQAKIRTKLFLYYPCP